MLKLEVERDAQKNVRHTQKHRCGFLTEKVVDYSKYPTLGTDFSKENCPFSGYTYLSLD